MLVKLNAQVPETPGVVSLWQLSETLDNLSIEGLVFLPKAPSIIDDAVCGGPLML